MVSVKTPSRLFAESTAGKPAKKGIRTGKRDNKERS